MKRKQQKFTPTQLSRILSAHEGRRFITEVEDPPFTPQYLGRVGGYMVRCCINQAAEPTAYGDSPGDAIHLNMDAAFWFDKNYDPYWTSTELLAHLEQRGWA